MIIIQAKISDDMITAFVVQKQKFAKDCFMKYFKKNCIKYVA